MIKAAMQQRIVSGLLALVVSAFSASAGIAGEVAQAAAEHGGESGVHWQEWKAGNEITNQASLQRGAANFVNYCMGCHSLKYLRYERMAKDLDITIEQLQSNLIPTGAKSTDYMLSTFPAADAETWFGRAPPDLSLVSRYRGTDWVYQFLKGFYADASKPVTGTNNLVLDGAAMPAVLSDLEGVKAAVFAEHAGAGGHSGKMVERFEMLAQGRLKPEEFDGFVRDTVNFLDYAGDPSQVQRRSIGIWVVLFLLVFTAFAWMLKKEYWKDVH
jgi:ubiquinol-cytochrome c reductase cytochrome c1 subunit